jgi:predicted dehydrogenase
VIQRNSEKLFLFYFWRNVLEPVKYGVIGVGGMGGAHCSVLSELEEVDLVAVADVNEETARSVGEKYGSKPFTDYKDLIDNGGVEVVAVVTPHFFHPPIAKYAASRGIHVLSEKPLAVTVKAAQEMVDACEKAGVFLGVMFQQRMDSVRRKMHDIITSGELGNIHRISMTAPWYRTQAYYDSGDWRGTWKGEGGGVLMNQAPHTLDQFLWIGGAPKSIQSIALTRLHNIEVENTALAICDYGDGKIGTFYASTAEAPIGERIEVVGEKGALVSSEGKLRRMTLAVPVNQHLRNAEKWGALESQWSDVEVEEENGELHKKVHQCFAQAIRANDPSLMTASGEDGLRAIEFANAILTAGYTRREVKLPLDPEAFETLLGKLQSGTKPEELYLG